MRSRYGLELQCFQHLAWLNAKTPGFGPGTCWPLSAHLERPNNWSNGDLTLSLFLWYGLQDKTAPRLAITEEELLNQWKSANRIFLFSKEKPLESFIARHPDLSYRILGEAGGKKVLVNW
ncbi:MAG: hypothetical protein WAN11_12895 [Syntrophobacteraceae bacterium]